MTPAHPTQAFMRLIPALLFTTGLMFSATRVHADAEFTAAYNEVSYLIESARDEKPLVNCGGKLVVPRMETMRLVQKDVDYLAEGFPQWAYVRKVKAEVSSIRFVDSNSTLNSELYLEFLITAPTALKNVYVAIYLDGGPGQRGIVVRDVGNLKQWETGSVKAMFQVDNNNPGFNYNVFVFSNGREMYTDFKNSSTFLTNFYRAVWSARKDGSNEKMRLLYSFLPQESRRAKKDVTARVCIRQNGSVETVKVISEDKKLVKSVENAVMNWWFAPPANTTEKTNWDVVLHLTQWKTWSDQSIELHPVD